MDFSAPFGPWLKKRRSELGLTQGDLARRISYSPETVRKIEAGVLRPSRQLADLLSVPLEVPEKQHSAFLAFAADSGKPAQVRENHLPKPLTKLLGREGDLVALQKLLKQPGTRLLTLVGPGGVGKTRLAIEASRLAAANFADGVFFVELAALTTPELVLAILLKTLGAELRADGDALASIIDQLGEKQVLLTLDNFEQVLDAAPLLAQLLAGAAGLKIMVTSREPLRLSGEQRYAVEPLSLADDGAAVQLFSMRAQQVLQGFSVGDSDKPVVAAICRRLDGLPLAIELAAARVTLFSLKELLDRLSGRLAVLTDGPRDLPARQRTLQATLDWSYDLLSPAEQSLYRRVSVFAAGCPIEGVQAVCAGGDAAVTVGALVDKHLLTRGVFKSGQSRIGMLETMREHAQARLVQSGELEECRAKMTEFVAGVEALRIIDVSWSHEAPDTWREAMKLVQLQHSIGTTEMRLLLNSPVDAHEHKVWAERIVADMDKVDADPVVTARALALISMLWRLSTVSGDSASIRAAAVAAARKIPDLGERADLLNDIAAGVRERGDFASAIELLTESISNAREMANYNLICGSLKMLSEVYVGLEDTDRALDTLAEADAVYLAHPSTDERGRMWGKAWQANHRAHVAMLRSDHANARALFDESTQSARGLPDQALAVVQIWNEQSLAEICLAEGKAVDTFNHVHRGLSQYLIFPDAASAVWLLATLAGALVLDEEPERGAVMWGASEALRARIGCRIASASRLNRERTVMLLRQALGAERMDQLIAEGARMNFTQALDYARAGFGAD